MSKNARDTILYVDDEEINLFLFQKRFENELEVITASSGQEALEALDKNVDRINIVISDLRMPGMDGLELIRAARARYTSGISYYILTGYEFNQELEKALNENLIDNLFKKPFNFDEILAAIGKES